jgi:Uma2 family endonuclease
MIGGTAVARVEDAGVVATKLMTFEEFEAMPDDGKRYELVDGELREMPPAGMEHGDVGTSLNAPLWFHVRERRLGRVFGPDTGFRIFPDRDIAYAPDASYVSNEQLATVEDYTKMGRLAPDLVVEVVSPSDRMADVLDKVRDYLLAGVRLVWVVEPRHRAVTAYPAIGEPVVYRENDILDGGDVLPEFRLTVAEIFA